MGEKKITLAIDLCRKKNFPFSKSTRSKLLLTHIHSQQMSVVSV